MKKVILLVIFVLSCILALPQISENLSRKIVWLPKKSIIQSKDTVFIADASYILDFENAVYPDIQTLIPVFAEQIYINKIKFQNYDVKVELKNTNFILMTANEVEGVAKLGEIAEKIVLNYKVHTARDQRYVVISFIPIIKDVATGGYKKLTDFDILITAKNQPVYSEKSEITFAQNSVLSAGKWLKIKLSQDGVYKISHAQLKELGFNNPADVRVFGNDAGMLSFKNREYTTDDLIENNIFKSSDYILFYAKGTTRWEYVNSSKMFMPIVHLFSDYVYYFLTDRNTGYDNNIQTLNQSAQAINNYVTNYNAFRYYEDNKYNLINSGRIWLGESFKTNNNQTFSFSFPNLVSASDMKLRISTYARSSTTSNFSYIATNLSKTASIEKASSDYSGVYAVNSNNLYTYPAPSSSDISLTLNFQGIPSADAWLDYIVYNAVCNLTYNGSPLHFRNINSVGNDKVTQFTISNVNSNVIIWDITDSRKPQKVNYTLSGNNASFVLETNELREFIAFEPQHATTPILAGSDLGQVANQNLHATGGEIDMIILSHKNFIGYAEEIAQIHRTHDGMNVVVVTNEQIYNEFSCGAPDVSAIKFFAKMIYDRGTTKKLKYLLLFGDGSYNNKEYSEYNNNYILTYQSENSFNENHTISYVTDDFFGYLDDDEYECEGLIDIGIGRMPVKTAAEAEVMITKIQAYLNKEYMGEWKNTICFIADDEDSNIHMNDAERLSNKVDTLAPELNIKKIYIDAYEQVSSALGHTYPDAANAVNNQFEKGAFIINYAGHGSIRQLMHESVITINDINGWTNLKHMPLVITATCEFSRYDMYQPKGLESNSAGEMVLLNPKGGAFAMLTTTRLVYSGGNYTLTNNFFDFAFKETRAAKYSLGEMMMLTKNKTYGTNKFNFTLLGDPALKLSYPEHKIVATKINNKDISSETDTVKSLSKVTIEGEIRDVNDNLLTDFNGTVYPTILDKQQNLLTQNNDNTEAGAFKYVYQNNILYKGKATVTNGKFSFDFIAPKDILYNFGYGKISFYADNKNTDANGCSDKIFIGGTSEKINTDNQGPEIKLFINDQNFVNGSITNENPKIYSLLSDSSGINTVGNGIGHDITVTLDKNNNKFFILNDFYTADIDSYQSGKVEYNLYRLEPGQHSLKLKAWDIHNNSSEQEIDFVVMEEKDFVITRLYNYPNPFTSKTAFYFEHNQHGTLNVLIQIFTVSGKLVKTIQYDMFANGSKSEGIEWNGLDDYGAKIGKGVYIYKIKARNEEGKTVEKFEKLLILK